MNQDADALVPSTPTISPFVVGGKFVGQEDKNNPPVQSPQSCNHGTETCSHMQCPKCGSYVDSLIGDADGGNQACLQCYTPKIIRK